MHMMLLHVAVINARFTSSLAHTAIEHSSKGLYINFKDVREINNNCVLGYGRGTKNNFFFTSMSGLNVDVSPDSVICI